jgi:hypothetical protein
MTTPQPFAKWGLSGTRAIELQPGETMLWHCSGGDAILPYRTAVGRPLSVRTSTFNETVILHNATLDPEVAAWNQYNTLPEWPWTACLPDAPAALSQMRQEYTFEAAP